MSLDFVLALHSHLPWVLNHGRWPHGSDWLTEAALDTYLPLLESLQALERDGVPAPVTLGITPVLANQLAHPLFRTELEAFFEQRLEACHAAPESLRQTGDMHLLPLAGFWLERIHRLRKLFHTLDGDLIAAFRGLEDRGRLEIISSAATHGFLPLLARDESIRLQLAVGVREHRRLFGKSPSGCWLPECAYRPRERWAPWPTAPAASIRRGIDEHLADAGYRYFFVDAHLVTGARPLGLTSDGEVTMDGEVGVSVAEANEALAVAQRSPYRAWRVSHPGQGASVAAFARDPKASAQVWSRHGGYPGDGAYLDFHKIRWPGGLKYWRVTGASVDLGDKAPYDPEKAATHADAHAAHFARLIDALAAEEPRKGPAVLAAPFDTELFGHWWFEGPHFLEETYRRLPDHPEVHATTASAHLRRHPPAGALRLPDGSWGANGNFSMWLSEQTAWTWERLWPLEDAYWEVAATALTQPATRTILAQATRELLLAQSSDWQFIISTGAVPDYAFRRFTGHCEDAERLVSALRPGHEAELSAALRLAEESHQRDDLFPDPLPAVEAVLAGSRTLALG
ncbi:MAG: putative alpha-amylase [Gemmatimonadetes bacterium]|nr:putative alpha-amylase [Gemmatimonadota bacterium]